MTTSREPLVDGFGRTIGDLRVSVTDRCNLRCTYCMPESGVAWIPRAGILTYEEIARVVSLLASMGVDSVRLTGGEPLMRSGIADLVRMIGDIPGIEDLSLTTNGLLLDRHLDALVSAGLTRINISLDTLDADRFAHITRRHGLDRVISSIDAALATGRLDPVKVNVVALEDLSEADILGLADLARSTAAVVRFIEVMPLDADRAWSAKKVMTGEAVRRVIEQRHELASVTREASATAMRWQFADGRGEIGFINSVSEPFCDDCNRIRLTADGMLRTCLFSLHETDLREPLRSGASDDDLEQVIRDAVWRKELKHRIGDEGFRQPPRTMSSIGG